MATSRSAGGRGVTSRSPIRTSPSVGSSSPAMHRRAVVLPQPDGPSSTRNSPSRTSSDSSCNARLAPPSNVFVRPRKVTDAMRSEEHTSELQSQSNLVCRLLLEKKKTISTNTTISPSRHAQIGNVHPLHVLVGARLKL